LIRYFNLQSSHCTTFNSNLWVIQIQCAEIGVRWFRTGNCTEKHII